MDNFFFFFQRHSRGFLDGYRPGGNLRRKRVLRVPHRRLLRATVHRTDLPTYRFSISFRPLRSYRLSRSFLATINSMFFSITLSSERNAESLYTQKRLRDSDSGRSAGVGGTRLIYSFTRQTRYQRARGT